MKNTIKVLGIIVLLAMIGFSMAACGDGDGPGIPGSGGGDNGGTGSATGSIKIVNNSYWSLSGAITQNNKTVKTITVIRSKESITYSEIPAGSYDIRLSGKGSSSWRRNVTVSKGNTSTVTVDDTTGWD